MTMDCLQSREKYSGALTNNNSPGSSNRHPTGQSIYFNRQITEDNLTPKVGAGPENFRFDGPIETAGHDDILPGCGSLVQVSFEVTTEIPTTLSEGDCSQEQSTAGTSTEAADGVAVVAEPNTLRTGSATQGIRQNLGDDRHQPYRLESSYKLSDDAGDLVPGRTDIQHQSSRIESDQVGTLVFSVYIGRSSCSSSHG